MRGIIVVVAIVVSLLCVIDASSTPGDLAGKLELESHHPTGVAWDGRYYWTADRKTDSFYKRTSWFFKF